MQYEDGVSVIDENAEVTEQAAQGLVSAPPKNRVDQAREDDSPAGQPSFPL